MTLSLRVSAVRAAALALLVALLAVVTVGVGPAVAHESAPSIRAVLDEVAPAVEGLDVSLAVSVATQIDVRNDGDDPVTFLDQEGRPFLRIARDGVEADIGLASWYLLNDPAGRVPDDGRVREDADAGPVWTRISNGNAWGWFDHRIHPGVVQVPADLADAEEPVDLATWAIPFVVGDGATAREAEVLGRIVHAPQRGTFRTDLEGSAPDGFEVAVLQGRVPGLFLRNVAGQEFVVDDAGTPFLRFLADGRVEANEHSPRWWDHARTSTATPLPSVAEDPVAEPTWVEVATSGTVSVLIPDAASPDPEPTDRVTEEQTVASSQLSVGPPGGPVEVVKLVTSWVPSEDLGAADCLPGPGCLQWADLVGAVGGIGVIYALIRVRRQQAARREGRTGG